MTKVHIEYFAQLRESAGMACETVETAAASPQALYAERRAVHGFPVEAKHIGIARNGAYDRSEAPLAEGDEIVFIPPIAGG